MTTAIDISNPDAWPCRMVLVEIAAVLRISRRSLYDRIASGRFPRSDDGRTWSRDVVKRYVDGQIKEFERKAKRGQLQMVGR